MNFLILTPWAVGSSIIQRILTLAFYLKNISVVNTHELVEGIEVKNGMLLNTNKKEYSQSLEQITQILKQYSSKTILVSRLSKYAIDNRKDSLQDQKNFFLFLDNFYSKKILCIRENIFEYALSWSIRNKSGLQNIFNKNDKEKVLQVSEVDEDYFLMKCYEYVNHQKWIEQNFKNIKKISYENMVTNTDNVIEELTGIEKDMFKQKFGFALAEILKIEYEYIRSLTNKKNFINLEISKKKALLKYKTINEKMQINQIIPNAPIKNTTLEDKMYQIKNFNKCLEKFYIFAKNYNWIDQSKATYDFWNKKYIC